MWMRAMCRPFLLPAVRMNYCSPLIVPAARFPSSQLQTLKRPAVLRAPTAYDIEVTASDGNGGTDVQTLTITVDGVNEDPVITSTNTASLDENTTAVTTITASDVDAGDVPTFSITGGAECRIISSPLIVPAARFHSSQLPTLKRPAVPRAAMSIRSKSQHQMAMAAPMFKP